MAAVQGYFALLLHALPIEREFIGTPDRTRRFLGRYTLAGIPQIHRSGRYYEKASVTQHTYLTPLLIENDTAKTVAPPSLARGGRRPGTLTRCPQQALQHNVQPLSGRGQENCHHSVRADSGVDLAHTAHPTQAVNA